MLFGNDWYPALARDHVTVVADAIAAVEPTGLRTADGTLHEVDTIIWGTGFAATEFLAPLRVTGVGGVEVHDVWSDGAHAHLGMTVPGFPRLFLVYGPHTNLGGNSIVGMLEAQARYIVQAVRAVADGARLDVRREVAERFDDEMQERGRGTVWAACSSWYRGPGGRVVTNWPGLVQEYVDRTARLDLADFDPGPHIDPTHRTQVTHRDGPQSRPHEHPGRVREAHVTGVLVATTSSGYPHPRMVA